MISTDLEDNAEYPNGTNYIQDGITYTCMSWEELVDYIEGLCSQAHDNGSTAIEITDKIMLMTDSNIDKQISTILNTYGITEIKWYNFTTYADISLSGMFMLCKNLQLELNEWDTSNVTDMSGMFNRCAALSVSINEWDTSNVTDMSGMFNRCVALSVSINEWDTSNVTDMSHMFNHSNVPEYIDVSKWDVLKVRDMSYMFFTALFDNIKLNLSDWNLESLISSVYMLNSTGLEIITTSGYNMKKMFETQY